MRRTRDAGTVPRFDKFDAYHGFKDETVKQELIQNRQLQAELLKALSPKAGELQKQLNGIWHDQLNYPAIEFGQPVLHF